MPKYKKKAQSGDLPSESLPRLGEKVSHIINMSEFEVFRQFSDEIVRATIIRETTQYTSQNGDISFTLSFEELDNFWESCYYQDIIAFPVRECTGPGQTT